MMAHPHITDSDAAFAALDEGPRTRQTERLCVATREVRPIADLIRFVVSPNGEVVPDLKGKLPGRGVWVTGTRAALAEAIKRKALSRGFKRDVRLSDDFPAAIERLLERSALDALAMAGKAGLVATGFTRVEAALAHGGAKALIHAADAAADGVKKLDSACRRNGLEGEAITVRAFTSAQLDLALGRPNVIHAALNAGPASDTFLTRWRRLERYRNGDLGSETRAAAPN